MKQPPTPDLPSQPAKLQMQPTAPKSLGRRSFLKHSLAASICGPAILSLEEQALLARGAEPEPISVKPGTAGKLPTGKIGKVEMSRLICGGNLISGYAHSRDLIYVSNLLKHYFTDQRIMETWALCESHGINTMIAYAGDPHAVEVYKQYRARGGKMQYLAQIAPDEKDLKTPVKEAVEAGAVGAFLVGNTGDKWARDGEVGRIGELITTIKEHGLIAGVAGHELRTPKKVEEAGIDCDFYMKTLHDTNYWSTRRPEQTQDVIDNYGVDNYWCRDPEETIRFMADVERPWMAYKVLAAGAVHPRSGLHFAFKNGADFAVVGFFDFQVAENAAITQQVLDSKLERQREWWA